jgi:hypothetical protein
MQRYKAVTPNPGVLMAVEDFPFDKYRWPNIMAVKAVNEGKSMGGRNLLKVKFSTQLPTEAELEGETLKRMRGFFFNRNTSNMPHVFRFRSRWWVRAKRSRREWEKAKKIGSHVICHSDLTLNKENLKQFGGHTTFVATWLPWEQRCDREGNIRSMLLYEVFGM